MLENNKFEAQQLLKSSAEAAAPLSRLDGILSFGEEQRWKTGSGFYSNLAMLNVEFHGT